MHRFATLLAGAVVLLIAAGALVKSKEAGLAVPDWPLSYGSLNPPRWWQIDNVRAEHGHRLIAGTVALATVLLAVWIARREPRAWVRRLAWGAVGAVLVQAVLGGITVLMFLPPPVSIAHAGMAEIFLCLIVTLAVVTARGWSAAPAAGGEPGLRPVARAGAVATGLVFAQILLGAVVRHFGAGLAIPDFPLAFGRLVPPSFDLPIALHFGHRLGGVAVLAAVAALVVLTFRRARRQPLTGLAWALAVLVPVQIGLGGAVVLTGRAVAPNTVHVAVGASVLALCLTHALWAARLRRGRRQVPLAVPVVTGASGPARPVTAARAGG